MTSILSRVASIWNIRNRQGLMPAQVRIQDEDAC